MAVESNIGPFLSPLVEGDLNAIEVAKAQIIPTVHKDGAKISTTSSYPVNSSAILPGLDLCEDRPLFRQRFDEKDHAEIIESLMKRAGPNAGAEAYLEAFFYMATSSVAVSQQAARAAIFRFGSLGAVMAAEPSNLMSTPGITETMALTLKSIHYGMLHALKEPISKRIDVSSDENVLAYLGHAMKYAAKEQLRILYLDRKNRLLFDELVYEGTVDHVPLYPREVVKKSLEHGASALIIAHNHPSGDPTPSRADIDTTNDIIKALTVFNITLHEHFIIGSQGIERLRANGYLKRC